MRSIIRRIYREHVYLLHATKNRPSKRKAAKLFLLPTEVEYFNKILASDPIIDYSDALKELTIWLHRYHETPVLLIVDEYDAPVMFAHKNGFMKKAISEISQVIYNPMNVLT